MRGFRHQPAEFVRWREENPGGYVVNVRSRSHGMLHRAPCMHLTFDPGAEVDLTAKPKLVSTDRRGLEAWAREAGLTLSGCQTCL